MVKTATILEMITKINELRKLDLFSPYSGRGNTVFDELEYLKARLDQDIKMFTYTATYRCCYPVSKQVKSVNEGFIIESELKQDKWLASIYSYNIVTFMRAIISLGITPSIYNIRLFKSANNLRREECLVESNPNIHYLIDNWLDIEKHSQLIDILISNDPVNIALAVSLHKSQTPW